MSDTQPRNVHVSGDGLHIPREWLAGADEVEIRVLASGEVRITPVTLDPLDGLADAPIRTGLGDAEARQEWLRLSLESAMRGIQDDSGEEYSEEDVAVRFR